MNPDVLDVALAVAAIVVFCSITALLVGALCAAGRADDHLHAVRPIDFYVGRDDLGNEYIVPVPTADDDDEIGRERARKRRGDLDQEFLP